MNFRLTDLTLAAVTHVARNMRARDRDEIFGLRWPDATPDDVATDCMACPAFSWVAWWQGRPTAVIGCIPMRPGVWTAYCFATDDFRQIVCNLTRHVRRVMMPGLIKAGVHRLECYSALAHTDAHRWLEMLGAERESVVREYGRNREDYLVFCWREETIDVQGSQRQLGG